MPPPPRNPQTWRWQCHQCRQIWSLSCTRRCLECSHTYCISADPEAAPATPPRQGRKRRRNKGMCAGEFDFAGWEQYGSWRRKVSGAGVEERDRDRAFLRRTHNCTVDCDSPSQCNHRRYELAAQALMQRKQQEQQREEQQQQQQEQLEEPSDAEALATYQHDNSSAANVGATIEESLEEGTQAASHTPSAPGATSDPGPNGELYLNDGSDITDAVATSKAVADTDAKDENGNDEHQVSPQSPLGQDSGFYEYDDDEEDEPQSKRRKEEKKVGSRETGSRRHEQQQRPRVPASVAAAEDTEERDEPVRRRLTVRNLTERDLENDG